MMKKEILETSIAVRLSVESKRRLEFVAAEKGMKPSEYARIAIIEKIESDLGK